MVMEGNEAAWSSPRSMADSDDTTDVSRPLLARSFENENGNEPEGPATLNNSVAVAVGPRVEFIYVPKYPRTGSRQDALGVLGKTNRVGGTSDHIT